MGLVKKAFIVVGAKKIYDEVRKPANRERAERVIRNLKRQGR